MNVPLSPPEVILCDTTFVSMQERASGKPGSVAHWPAAAVHRLDHALLAVSIFTIAEMRAGRLYANWGRARSDAQEARLAAFVRVPLDDEVLHEYVTLHAWSRRGHATPHNDLWIAATALARGVPLVSCDRHFEGVAADHPLEHIYLPPVDPDSESDARRH
jgi:predicted nucleic acid-binding protein